MSGQSFPAALAAAIAAEDVKHVFGLMGAGTIQLTHHLVDHARQSTLGHPEDKAEVYTEVEVVRRNPHGAHSCRDLRARARRTP